MTVRHHRDPSTGKWVYNFGAAQWVLDDLFEDIAKFMDEPIVATMRKCQMGASRVDKLWECEDPRTDEDRQRFYRRTTAHIYEGANWHRDHPQPLRRWNIAEKCKGNVLIYGCGIGTEGLFALYNPDVTKVTFFDLPYSKITDFLHCRLVGHQPTPERHANVDLERQYPFNQRYDTIVCMDVLEHLENPQDILNQFGENLNPGGFLMVDAPFESIAPVGHLPQHRDLNLDEMIAKAGIKNYETKLLR